MGTKTNSNLFLILFGIACFWGSFVSSGQAELVTFLKNDHSVHENIFQIGQRVAFSVHLLGLEENQKLEGLSAIVSWNNELLSEPQNVKAGEIISDDSEFLFSASDHEVDGSFQTFFGDTSIKQDGIFYQFETIAQAVGEGELRFTFLDAQASGTLEAVPIQGTTFDFEVAPVPEPSRFALTLCLLVALIFASWKPSSGYRA